MTCWHDEMSISASTLVDTYWLVQDKHRIIMSVTCTKGKFLFLDLVLVLALMLVSSCEPVPGDATINLLYSHALSRHNNISH